MFLKLSISKMSDKLIIFVIFFLFLSLHCNIAFLWKIMGYSGSNVRLAVEHRISKEPICLGLKISDATSENKIDSGRVWSLFSIKYTGPVLLCCHWFPVESPYCLKTQRLCRSLLLQKFFLHLPAFKEKESDYIPFASCSSS